MGQICSVSLGEKFRQGRSDQIGSKKRPCRADLKIVQVASDEAPKPLHFLRFDVRIEGVERIREGRIPPT